MNGRLAAGSRVYLISAVWSCDEHSGYCLVWKAYKKGRWLLLTLAFKIYPIVFVKIYFGEPTTTYDKRTLYSVVRA